MNTQFVRSINVTDQVVESDALLSTAHVFKEAVICNQQQGTGVLLVIMNLPLLSVVVTCEQEAAGTARERQMHRRGRKRKWSRTDKHCHI